MDDGSMIYYSTSGKIKDTEVWANHLGTEKEIKESALDLLKCLMERFNNPKVWVEKRLIRP